MEAVQQQLHHQMTLNRVKANTSHLPQPLALDEAIQLAKSVPMPGTRGPRDAEREELAPWASVVGEETYLPP